MKPALLALTAGLALALGGCAVLDADRSPERDAQLRLERGLSAFAADHYSEAFEDLSWVYLNCPGREAGARALVALAALELDPRNRGARPHVGTELLARAIRSPGTPRWSRPLVETSFLTTLALGAPHPEPPATAEPADSMEDDPLPDSLAGEEVAGEEIQEAFPVPSPTREAAYGCGAPIEPNAWTPPPLPELPGPTMVALLADAEADRDSLASRADTLQTQLEAVQEQLTATRNELERIRRTLKP